VAYLKPEKNLIFKIKNIWIKLISHENLGTKLVCVCVFFFIIKFISKFLRLPSLGVD